MKKTKLHFQDLPKDYAALCRALLPRPIHDDDDYAKVARVTDAMSLWHEEFSLDQADYFDLLCWILEEYDSKHAKLPKVTAVDTLKQLMEARGMGPADLSQVLGGARSLGASILRGERKLMLKHVRNLFRHFGISADNFLG
jgi:HTH-type transcriptional regulator / antitoxin HigA